MANNMVSARVTVRGTRPLLWHHFGPDALPLEKQERTGVAGHDPSEWRKTVLVTKEGRLFIDPSYAFACIRDGSRYTKKGRGSIQTMVSATLQVTDDKILLDRFLPENIVELANAIDEPVYLDIRSVRNPTTKARNVRYRVAASSGWIVTFNLLWDKTIVSRGEMEGAVRDAGRFSGLGDGRAIGFGRFLVDSFEILEQEDAAS